LTDIFPVQNGLKYGGALSPQLFNFALEYAISKVQENQVRLKLNGIHQLLTYTDDMNLLGDDIDIINRNTGTLIDASKEAGLEVNVEKTEYMMVSHDQNADQNQHMKIRIMVSSGMLCRVVLTRATWRNIPEDTILHSHRRENLKSYK
jgi:hypothetical protein